jgi:hypothetical protein
MKQPIALIVICLWTSVLSASGKIKLNVKTGLWQTTTTRTVTGSTGIPPEVTAKLTPAQRARLEAAAKKDAGSTARTVTHKDCLTPEELAEDYFRDRSHGDNAKCEETMIKSTATDLEVREACTYGDSKTDAHLSFHADSSEHVTGSGTITATADGHTMSSTMKMDSKWISASCTAGKKYK